jgi:hypothetical protein
MSRKRMTWWPMVNVLAAVAAAGDLSCGMPPAGTAGAYRPVEISAQARGVGVLPVFITDQTTDGRNVKLRGKIRNPYPESILGVRLVYCYIAAGAPARVLDHTLRIIDLEVGAGQDALLRWDIQTMYAGSPGAHFSLMAFAIKRGGKDLPLPPGWEEGDDEKARATQ